MSDLCNVSDVSMTRDVSTDIKTPPSVENTNPDYYKQEISRLTAELGEVLKAFDDAQAEIARLNEIIARLKEDGSALAAVCDALKWRCEG